jgi:outer membrane protein assembly factor BamB
LWSIPWRVPWDVNASSPVVVGTTLVVSSGYDKAEIGGRAIAYELGAREPRQLWRNDDVKTRFGSCAVSGGRVFAVSESTGGVLCLDLATGVEKWRQPHTKFGNLVVAGGHLVVLGDTGELLLAPVAGDGFQPLCRTELPKGKYWVQPTVAGGRIYCRSNQGVVTAVDCR